MQFVEIKQIWEQKRFFAKHGFKLGPTFFCCLFFLKMLSKWIFTSFIKMTKWLVMKVILSSFWWMWNNKNPSFEIPKLQNNTTFWWVLPYLDKYFFEFCIWMPNQHSPYGRKGISLKRIWEKFPLVTWKMSSVFPLPCLLFIFISCFPQR